MTGRGRRVAPIGVRPATCPLCYAPLPSHLHSCPSHRVSWIERAGEIFLECSQEQAREIQRVLRQAVGSSSTVRGARDSRTWSVTDSFGSVSRRLKRAKSNGGSQRTRSTNGTASTKTPDSSRSYSGAADTIGTAVRTPAERCAVGEHLWGYETKHPEDIFCVRGCGKRVGQ